MGTFRRPRRLLLVISSAWSISPGTRWHYSYIRYAPNVTGQFTPLYSNSRDNLSHYGYVGVQHTFLENLTGSANVGVQYTEYYNDPNSTSSLGPYADASLIYTYASGSYAQLGLTQSRNATDTVQIEFQWANHPGPGKHGGLWFHQPSVDSQAHGQLGGAFSIFHLQPGRSITASPLNFTIWV